MGMKFISSYMKLTKKRSQGSVKNMNMASSFVQTLFKNKRPQFELEKQSRVLELLFEHSLSPLAIMDRNFNFIRVNKAYAMADNKLPSDYPGLNHFSLYPSDLKEIFDQVVQTKIPFQAFARPFTYAHSPERGITYWDWNLVPIENSIGEVDMLILSLIDVTQRVEAEEISNKAFNASYSPTVIIKMIDRTIFDANEAFLQTTGYTREEVIGRKTEDLNIWMDPDDLQKLRTTLASEGKVRNLNTHFKTPGGIREGLLFADTFTIKNDHYVMAIFHDLTEKRRMQKELNQLDRLNLVGQMAAGIGHEIRNPMTTVRGFLQMLGNRQEYLKDSEFFKIMIDELDRANSIITEFLSIAKEQSSEQTSTNLNTIITTLFPLITADAMLENKSIILNLNELPSFPVNENEIRQLILNMVRNGLEAMEPRGQLTIRTRYTEDEVIFSVQDQGKGIDPNVFDKIGTPFFTTKDYGTGLGLAICYSIAARHKAVVDFTTGTQGTTFSVRFRLFEQH